MTADMYVRTSTVCTVPVCKARCVWTCFTLTPLTLAMLVHTSTESFTVSFCHSRFRTLQTSDTEHRGKLWRLCAAQGQCALHILGACVHHILYVPAHMPTHSTHTQHTQHTHTQHTHTAHTHSTHTQHTHTQHTHTICSAFSPPSLKDQNGRASRSIHTPQPEKCLFGEGSAAEDVGAEEEEEEEEEGSILTDSIGSGTAFSRASTGSGFTPSHTPSPS